MKCWDELSLFVVCRSSKTMFTSLPASHMGISRQWSPARTRSRTLSFERFWRSAAWWGLAHMLGRGCIDRQHCAQRQPSVVGFLYYQRCGFLVAAGLLIEFVYLFERLLLF